MYYPKVILYGCKNNTEPENNADPRGSHHALDGLDWNHGR